MIPRDQRITSQYLRELAGGGTGPDPPPAGWTAPFVADFRRRAAALLSGPCRDLAPGLALGLLSPRLSFSEAEAAAAVAAADAAPPVVHADGTPLTPHDLARLGAYAAALADAALVGDLVPALAAAWVGGRLPVSLSPAQAALLVCVGLQRASTSVAAARLGLPSHQAMALFNKAIRRLHAHLASVDAAAAGRDLAPALPKGAAKSARVASLLPSLDPLDEGLDAELDAAAAEAKAADAAEVAVALGGRAGMERFAVAETGAALAASLPDGALTSGALVSFRADPAAKAAAAAAAAAPTPSTAMYKRGGDKKHKSGRKSSGSGGKKQRA
jgi:N-acetyltransferase 10